MRLHPTGTRKGTVAPALTAASTPAEPSAFITTTDHDPSCTRQVRRCAPLPCADAAQKWRSLGGAGAALPRGGREGAGEGGESAAGRRAERAARREGGPRPPRGS